MVLVPAPATELSSMAKEALITGYFSTERAAKGLVEIATIRK